MVGANRIGQVRTTSDTHLSQMEAPRGPAATPESEATHRKVMIARILPKKELSPKKSCRSQRRRDLGPGQSAILDRSSPEIGPRGAPLAHGNEILIRHQPLET